MLLEVLRDGGYAGWLVVETEQDPQKAHPLTYARMGFAHLSRLLVISGCSPGAQRPTSPKSLDHLIRPLQQRRRHRQPERLGSLEVDDQLELGRLLDGQVAGLGAL